MRLMGQSSGITSVNDSLYNIVLDSDDPNVKMELLRKLVGNTFYTKHRKTVTLKYIKEAEKLDKNALTERSKFILKYILSWKHEHYNEFEEKAELLNECIVYFEPTLDSFYYVRSMYFTGELYFRTGRYESGLKYLSKLREVLPGVEHRLYSVVIRKLVRTYSNLNQNETALELISDLITDYEKRDNFKWDVKHMRHNMVKGMVLHRLARTHDAIAYTEKVLEESAKVDNKVILNNSKSELARYHLSLGQLATAKKLAHEAVDHYEILRLNYPSMTSTRVTLGRIYQEEGAYSDAKKYYLEAIELAEKHHRLLNHKQALEGLLVCNMHLGSDKNELVDQFVKYDLLKDSLLNDNINSTVQDLRMQYETEKKEDAIVQLNRENELSNSSLKIARRNNFYLTAAILFLLLSAILLSYLYNNNLRARKLLEHKNEIIAESLNEKQLLLKEIHHRVKNNLQIVSSLLSLQSNYIKDEKVLKALLEGQNRVQSMALIHQNLYQDGDLRNINVQSYFRKLVSGLYQSYSIDPERILLDLHIEDLRMDVETVIPLGLITNELVTNVFKYAFDDEENGRVSISLTGSDPYVLLVRDNGKGLDKETIDENAESFGYQMIHAFCNKLDAQMDIVSDKGTSVKITIPHKKTPTPNEENSDSRR